MEILHRTREMALSPKVPAPRPHAPRDCAYVPCTRRNRTVSKSSHLGTAQNVRGPSSGNSPAHELARPRGSLAAQVFPVKFGHSQAGAAVSRDGSECPGAQPALDNPGCRLHSQDRLLTSYEHSRGPASCRDTRVTDLPIGIERLRTTNFRASQSLPQELLTKDTGRK